MWDPRVATVAVVLDDHDACPKAQEWPNSVDHGGGIADKVKAVRGEQPVKRLLPEGDRIAEVRRHRLETRRRKAPGHRLGKPPQVRGVAIDCDDLGIRPKEFGQGKGERAAAGPELKPASAGSSDAVADQADVIVMVHRRVIVASRPVMLIGSATAPV